jgi:hypothetical protein
MLTKKGKKDRSNATVSQVEKEIGLPRMSKSARRAELNLDTARVPEQPSTTVLGTVEKIIRSSGPSQPGKAQIAVQESDSRYRDFRIENTLTDEYGDNVLLKKGAHVEITVRTIRQ